MKLSELEISGVRNVSSVSIQDFAQINIFSGPNGAGKTSILEAIHILGLARSFRGTQLQPVIQYHQDTCTVFGKVLHDDQPALSVGVKRAKWRKQTSESPTPWPTSSRRGQAFGKRASNSISPSMGQPTS